jgi:hypothetical protein
MKIKFIGLNLQTYEVSCLNGFPIMLKLQVCSFKRFMPILCVLPLHFCTFLEQPNANNFWQHDPCFIVTNSMKVLTEPLESLEAL